jgi:hypothetical protein
MMSIQQQQPTAVASPGYGFAPTTGRHFPSAGLDQQFTGAAGNSKYPAISSSSVSSNAGGTSSSSSGTLQSQPQVLAKGLNHSQQLGVRTELHSLPSNEPIRQVKIRMVKSNQNWMGNF